MKPLATLAALIVRRRRVVAVAAVAVCLLALIPAAGIQIDFTPQAFYAGRDDLVAYSESFREDFGYEDALLMVVLESLGGESVIREDLLGWQDEAALRLQEIDGVESILTAPLVDHWMLAASSVSPLAAWSTGGLAGKSGARESRIERLLERSNLLSNLLVGRSGTTASMILFIEPRARVSRESLRLTREVRREIAERPPPPGYRARVAGLPAFRSDIVSGLQEEQKLFVPLAAVLAFLVMVVALGSVGATGVALAGPLGAIGLTLGVLAWSGFSLGIVSNVLPVLLLIIGAANGVHVVSRYQEELRRWGDRRKAATHTVEAMARACFLTFLTTAVGFASLLAARSQALSDFGWQSSMGMGWLYLGVLFILGPLLPLIGPRKEKRRSEPGGRLLSGLAQLVATGSLRPLVPVALLLALSLLGARGLRVNSYFLDTFADDHPTMELKTLMEEEFGGFLPLEISLQASQAGVLLQPQMLERMRQVQDFAERQSGVLATVSPHDLLMEVERWAGRQTVQSDTAVSAVGGQAAMLVPQIRFIADEGRRARILIRVADIGSRRIRALVLRLEEKLDETFPSTDGLEVRITGDAYLAAITMDGFVNDLLLSFAGALVVIFGAIALLFRSLRLALLAVPANLAPLVLTLGYMGWRGLELNAGNVIVFAIGLGVAVDDTIHFLARFREELAVGTVQDAVRRTLAGTGHAILLSSILVLSGLAVLGVSSFLPTQRFAELMVVTMAGAVIGDLVLLPVLLCRFSGRAVRPPR